MPDSPKNQPKKLKKTEGEKVPNAETIQAMEESRQSKSKRFSSVEELMARLDSEDEKDNALAIDRLENPGKRFSTNEVKELLNL